MLRGLRDYTYIRGQDSNTFSSVLNIGCNIDIADDIVFWNTKRNHISSFIPFNIFRKIAAQYRLGPNIVAAISDAK